MKVVSSKSVSILSSLPALLFLMLPAFFNHLGEEPWKTLFIRSGYCSLGLLFFCLILSPIKTVFPQLQIVKDLNRYKKEIGVAAFIYAFAHLSFYMADAILRKGQLIIAKFFRPVIFPGLLAFLILLALTLTSNRWSVEKLTYKKWKGLHRLVYIAEVCVFIHVVQQSVTWALVTFIPLATMQILRIQSNRKKLHPF
ncbi:MAG: ferric reductase-like transmembrane domain-containing protein [Simkaniaceae bacterium]|nr:ferric reductase-like transmembrane domain-containing protein [Simkaniaceae bacterium]